MDNWTAWKDIFFAAVDDCIPKYRQKKRLTAPWITKGLLNFVGRKKSPYKKAKKSGRDETWTAYRALNNSLKKKCSSAKWQHLKELTGKLKTDNNAKPFWNYVKSKRKGTNDLALLKEDGKEITDDESIAQEMNLYFSSVFTQEQSNLPEFGNIINDRLSSILCTTSEVEKYLKTLNAHKSPGPDLIPPRILKECAHELSTPLCALFNKSFRTGLLRTLENGQHYTNSQKGTQTQKRELPSNLFNLRCLQSGGEYSTIQSYSFLVRSPRLKPKSVWLLKREIFTC